MNGRPVASGNQDARCDASEEGELVSRLGLVLLSSDQLLHRESEKKKKDQRLSFAISSFCMWENDVTNASVCSFKSATIYSLSTASHWHSNDQRIESDSYV